jgi:L-ascorbate metabolism protein UlaG (beta-lactamase superfamily)
MADPPRGDRDRLTWLGQAGFRFDVGSVSFVVDPWLSPHELRLASTPATELAADGIDWVLITHEHLDHLDLPLLPTVLERSPAASVVLPKSIVPLLEGIVDEGRTVGVQPGDSLDLGGVNVRVVPAFHGVTMEDAYGDGSSLGSGPRFVGYVIGGESRLYHAGDTIVTDELLAALLPLDVEIALLPINGRDAERESRGIVGNMDASEAVELALEIGAPTVVPYHWDGFAGNTVPPGSVVDAAAGRINVVVPARDRELVL